MREYYAELLTEMLHNMEEWPNGLPWRVYQVGITIDLWVADCKSERVARILVDALTEDERKIEDESTEK